ncbi:flagellar biosynthesis protein FlgE [Methylobacterium radiotolerans]|nr:flagellar biosynthesis protein FlgE [Methylobacterium radiotolerans]
MDLFRALQTSVSGLQAQSYAISNISGNIANSQTTGYKRVDTSFVDMVTESAPKREVAGSVLAQSQLTNSIAGNIISTTIPTNMAINGTGFFTVMHKTGDANSQPTFDKTPLYTRRGDFAQDKDGYLVNGSGAYLSGTTTNPTTGETTTGPIKIGNYALKAQATTTIDYGGNLPATPTVTAKDSHLYNPSTASLKVTTTDGSVTPNLATASATDVSDLTNNSILGPQLTMYTETGSPVTLSTRWAKVQDADPANKKDAVWNLFYQSDTISTPSVWANVGMGVTFDSSGQMKQPATGVIPIAPLTVNGTSFGSVNVNLGKNGLTQYADATGAATTSNLDQNGSAAGTLTSVSMGVDGKINGAFSNGSIVPIATVGIAQFKNPDGLKANSDGNYLQTAESGKPDAGLNGSTITGSSIEQSNTDIASEFSKMIVTQQAYSANTRVMSTAQTMMSDLLNVIR